MKRSVLAALLLVTSFVAVGVLTSSPASAATCSATDVTVVVQFPDHRAVGCASGDPDSGYAALQKAGFSITYATGNGAGAICQISGYPDHPCPSMPSANAYWAYFHAKPGGSWSYSQAGGASYDPKPGSVEGWAFGDYSAGKPLPGRAPDITAASPTKAPSKKPTKKATQHVQPAATADVEPVETPAAAAPTLAASASADATATPGGAAVEAPATTAAPSATTAPSATAEAGTPTKLTETDDTSSGGASWIWGLVLLGVIAAGGATAAVVRRRG